MKPFPVKPGLSRVKVRTEVDRTRSTTLWLLAGMTQKEARRPCFLVSPVRTVSDLVTEVTSPS